MARCVLNLRLVAWAKVERRASGRTQQGRNRVRSFPGMLRAWVLAAVLATGQEEPSASAGDAPIDAPQQQEEAEEKRGLEGIGIPLVSYNTDLGFGIGAVGGAYYYAPGFDPYQHALAAQVFFTTQGVRNHWLRYDGPSLLGRARLEVRAEYRRDLLFPFYGVGNEASPEFHPGTSAPRAFAFDQFYPGGWARIRTRPLGEKHPLEVWGGYGYHWVRIRPYPGSVLEQSQPVGIRGGNHGQLFVGLIWDTRDFEPDPTRGGIEELSVRISGAPTLSAYAYSGVTFSERRFWSLSERVVFAQRIILDAMFGEVPVFVLADIGGTGTEGIGGMSSVRGVPRNRYVGSVKVASNSELRFYVWDFSLFGETTKVGGVAYFDIGRVWHPDVDDGPWWRWHPGVGTGLRVARLAAVARVDYAVATEDLRQAIYVTFGHMF